MDGFHGDPDGRGVESGPDHCPTATGIPVLPYLLSISVRSVQECALYRLVLVAVCLQFLQRIESFKTLKRQQIDAANRLEFYSTSCDSKRAGGNPLPW